MSCGKRSGKRESIRRQLSEIYARVLAAHGQEKAVAAMLAHRLAQCTHASECGRLCARLVKGPGVSEIYCVDIETGEKTPLYEALENPDFECPLGLF